MISPLLNAQPAPKPLLIPSSLVSKSMAISVALDKSLYSIGGDHIPFFCNGNTNCINRNLYRLSFHNNVLLLKYLFSYLF